jgi:hypothetical protein
MAAAFAAATSALGSQAADSGPYVATQREITGGDYPQFTVSQEPAPKKAESAHTAAENDWLTQERISDSNGSTPVPFIEPTASATADSTSAP